MFADYKATRTSMPDDLARQLPYVRRLFEALRTPVVEIPGFEADDVLATLVEQALTLPDLEIVVVSGDKDLLQLVGPRVRVLSVLGRTGERVMYDEAKVRERWGVEPAQIADVLALMGDAIDNIPGVKGVGEKTAVKLVSQFGSVDRLYENLTLVGGKLRETLAASRKQAILSRELAVLARSAPVDARPRRLPSGGAGLAAAARAVDGDGVHAADQGAAGDDRRGAAPSPSRVWRGAAALADYLARVPAGAPLARRLGRARRARRSRASTALGLFHPAAGAAWIGARVPADGLRRAPADRPRRQAPARGLARRAAPPCRSSRTPRSPRIC